MFYHALGLLSVAVVLGSAVVLAATLALLAVYRRKRRVAWPRVALLGGWLLHSPLSVALRLLGRHTELLDLFLIDAANAAMARPFGHAGPVRMLAVPQCLRSGDCRAPLHPELGYRCRHCGKCPLGELGLAAERRGFRFFIVPGDRMVKQLAHRLGADAAVGVACPAELSGAMLAGLRMGVAAVGVPLACDGCFETRVDLERVNDAMQRCGTSSAT